MLSHNITLEKNVLFLQGDIQFATVKPVLDELEKIFSAEVNAIDCHAVAQVDSSAVALLLRALQLAEEKRVSLTIAAVPDALKKLISLYGLEKLLIH